MNEKKYWFRMDREMYWSLATTLSMLLPVIRPPSAHSTHTLWPTRALLLFICRPGALHCVLATAFLGMLWIFPFRTSFYEREEELFFLLVRVRFHRFGRARAGEYRFSFLYVLTSPEKKGENWKSLNGFGFSVAKITPNWFARVNFDWILNEFL